jgi:hypothetical protein
MLDVIDKKFDNEMPAYKMGGSGISDTGIIKTIVARLSRIKYSRLIHGGKAYEDVTLDEKIDSITLKRDIFTIKEYLEVTLSSRNFYKCIVEKTLRYNIAGEAVLKFYGSEYEIKDDRIDSTYVKITTPSVDENLSFYVLWGAFGRGLHATVYTKSQLEAFITYVESNNMEHTKES